MKSICIKTNNSNYLEYLLSELKNCDLKNVYFSRNQFKNYKNIIIHYTGENTKDFISEISSILSLLVLDEIEEILLNKLLIQNYFYFDLQERNQIIDICFDLKTNNFTDLFNKKYTLLYKCFFDYLSLNKTLILDGFINFRIKNYINVLDETLKESVDIYVIEKEYLEFISLLKIYIQSTKPLSNAVYLIYSNSKPLLLDENKINIKISDNLEKATYLSDISFSANDYILNTLLNLLPKTIYLELKDNNYPIDFINTLTLIFENRIQISCKDSGEVAP